MSLQEKIDTSSVEEEIDLPHVLGRSARNSNGTWSVNEHRPGSPPRVPEVARAAGQKTLDPTKRKLAVQLYDAKQHTDRRDSCRMSGDFEDETALHYSVRRPVTCWRKRRSSDDPGGFLRNRLEQLPERSAERMAIVQSCADLHGVLDRYDLPVASVNDFGPARCIAGIKVDPRKLSRKEMEHLSAKSSPR